MRVGLCEWGKTLFSCDHRWLEWADALQKKQDELFLDEKGGGYFASTGKDPSVLLRSKSFEDSAEPSENSISAHNLIRLAAMLDQPERIERAKAVLRAAAPLLGQAPTAAPLALVALDAARTKPAQIVIAGNPDAEDTRKLLEIVRKHRRPHQILLLADGAAGQKFLGQHAEFYQSITTTDGKATAYVCENFVCQLPTADPAKLRELLTKQP